MAEVVPVEPKKPWQSKTLWMALIVAIVPFFPAAQEFVKANPEMVGLILGGVFGLLRFITKGKIVTE